MDNDKAVVCYSGPHLADALISSPVIQGEDGTGAVGLGAGGFEFVDPNEDPELALVSVTISSFISSCKPHNISGLTSVDGRTTPASRG